MNGLDVISHLSTANKTVNSTDLTWLANMSEHLVLSVGSAAIRRINCSMGVIPDGKTLKLASECDYSHFLIFPKIIFSTGHAKSNPVTEL